ncbi:unnamed protein product [Boreogadus saida]
MAGSGAALRLHEFRERQDASSAEPWTPRVIRAGRDVRGLYPGELGRVHLLLKSSGSDQALRPSSHQAEKEEQEEVYKRSYDLQVLRLLEIQRHSQAPQRPPETSYQHHYGLQAPLVPQQNHTVSPTHRPFTSDSM